MSEKFAPLTGKSQKQNSGPAPDLSIHMPTYVDGKQLSELTVLRAGQTKPLFDLRTEAAAKDNAEE